jgi:hypothetical protein
LNEPTGSVADQVDDRFGQVGDERHAFLESSAVARF